MNIYFLVEGKTESKIYPKWLSFLTPKLNRVDFFDKVVADNYFLFSSNGMPALINTHLHNAVEDINKHKVYDYLVICLDADNKSTLEAKKEVFDFMNESKIMLQYQTKLEIIVQNKCIETWFLGNPKIFKKNPDNDFLKECVAFYNVKQNNPELMGKMLDYEGTASIFHEHYLRELLAEKSIRYSKKNPQGVIEKYFLDALIKRNKDTNHLQSFKHFVDFCQKIK